MARKGDDGERRVETDIETERNEREGERRREESSIDAAGRDEDDVGQRAGVFGVDDEENRGAASRGVGMRRGPGHGRAGVEGERLQSQPSTRAMRILRESEQAQQEEDKRDAMQTATTTAKSPPVAPVTKSQASGGRKGRPVVSSSSRSTQATRKDPRLHQRLEPLEYTRPLGGSLERAGMSVYTYNVNTSSLELQGASRDAEGAIGVETVRGFSETQPSVMYVESAVGRGFRRVDLRGNNIGNADGDDADGPSTANGRRWRRAHNKSPKNVRQIQSTRPFLFSISHWNASISSVILHFSEGVLGGVCVLVFAMTYFFDAPNLPTGFLRYYSEIATTASRLVITLSAISFAGACDRYARCSIRGWDTISGFSGRRSSRLLSASVILLYAIALVVSVVEYPFEEQMYYASQRVKNWWDYPTTSDFDTALDTWHAANFFRLFCCILAWLLTCYDNRISQFEGELGAEDDVVSWQTSQLRDEDDNSTIDVQMEARAV